MTRNAEPMDNVARNAYESADWANAVISHPERFGLAAVSAVVDSLVCKYISPSLYEQLLDCVMVQYPSLQKYIDAEIVREAERADQ